MFSLASQNLENDKFLPDTWRSPSLLTLELGFSARTNSSLLSKNALVATHISPPVDMCRANCNAHPGTYKKSSSFNENMFTKIDKVSHLTTILRCTPSHFKTKRIPLTFVHLLLFVSKQPLLQSPNRIYTFPAQSNHKNETHGPPVIFKPVFPSSRGKRGRECPMQGQHPGFDD